MTTFSSQTGIPAAKTREMSRSERSVEHWCWAILLAIIFEGALRKWLLPPSLQTVAYLIKYFLAFAFVLKFPLKQNNTPLGNGYTATLAFSSFLLPSLLIGFRAYPMSAMMTLTNAVLWPVFAFHLANQLTPAIIEKLTKKLAFLAIGMSILGSAQYASPPGSSLNRYAWNSIGLNDEASTFNTSSGVRATGTFSFITGMGAFASFSFVWFTWQYLSNPKKSGALSMCGALACVVCILTSGSRGPLMYCATSVAIVLVVARRFKILMSMIGLAITCYIGLSLLPNDSLVDAYVDRATNAGDTFQERAIDPLTEFIDQIEESPFGDGLGQHSQLVTLDESKRIGTGTMNSREDAKARVASEAGFLGIGCLFGTLLILSNYLVAALNTGTLQIRIASGSIGSFILLTVFACTWYDHVASAFCWFLAGVWLSTLATITPRRQEIAHRALSAPTT
jgi:hypothetical protein